MIATALDRIAMPPDDGEASAGFAITGTGEAGATVTLSFDISTTLTGGNTALVDGSGNWTIAVAGSG